MRGLQEDLPSESTPQYLSHKKYPTHLPDEDRADDVLRSRSGQLMRSGRRGPRFCGVSRKPTWRPASARALGLYETVTKEVRLTPKGRAVTTVYAGRNSGKKKIKTERPFEKSAVVNKQLGQYFRTSWHFKRGVKQKGELDSRPSTDN